jgi:hypothetical protein
VHLVSIGKASIRQAGTDVALGNDAESLCTCQEAPWQPAQRRF